MSSGYNPLNLAGKRVFVSGGSSGIGRATAIALSRLDATVVLSGRREEMLGQTLQQMTNPEKHHVEKFDLNDIDQIPSWFKALAHKLGGTFDGLVHAAGMHRYTPIRTLSRSLMEQMMIPNVYAALALVRAVSARGVGSEGASLVMISSVAALRGSTGLAVYSATKGAVTAAVRSMAVELREKKMRINCIAPGLVETPMLSEALTTMSQDEVRQQFLGIVPAEEVAVLGSYLISDAAKHITGSTFVIDGGYLC